VLVDTGGRLAEITNQDLDTPWTWPSTVSASTARKPSSEASRSAPRRRWPCPAARGPCQASRREHLGVLARRGRNSTAGDRRHQAHAQARQYVNRLAQAGRRSVPAVLRRPGEWSERPIARTMSLRVLPSACRVCTRSRSESVIRLRGKVITSPRPERATAPGAGGEARGCPTWMRVQLTRCRGAV
jgi:hypothetical protein